MASLEDQVARAAELPPDAAAAAYLAVVRDAGAGGADAIKAKEDAVAKLGALYVKEGQGEPIRALLAELRPFFATVPKAKTAKIVRMLLDMVAQIPGTVALQVALCTEIREWSSAEKRTFLRQRVETRLASLQLDAKDYQPALALLTSLLTEVKRLDDKAQLVEIHLLESRAHLALRNMPKSKAGLTAARTAANAIYVPPSMQAQLDTQTGIVGAEEGDFRTAYSYFFEAFEQFSSLEDSTNAVRALKYMLLCKVMGANTEDINAIISTKNALKYAGPQVDSLKAVADAFTERSLAAFEKALETYAEHLTGDPVLKTHLGALYDTMLEKNLKRLIEPFSQVEISHLAELINLPLPAVEKKLSQMILDDKLKGTLDQGSGNLVVFDEVVEDKLYPAALETIEALGKVVKNLHKRSVKLLA
uniref:PCI domain-containing protein n=1 Tax=Prasinoderma coloniale TaxID=156133 RepID=A0A7R9Y4Q5_9VIRI|eukprot:PRCOL_00005265-RA